MKRIFSVALGILAAIGGFVDIGDIVFNVEAGATLGYQLLWAVVIGVGGDHHLLRDVRQGGSGVGDAPSSTLCASASASGRAS